MSIQAAQLQSTDTSLAERARTLFRKCHITVGSVGRCARLSALMKAPVALEEACWYAGMKWNAMSLAAAGTVASEGLWAYQVMKQREDRANGLSLG